MRISSIFDKTGSFGAILAAMSCASCFPAVAALGASLGLGFLAQFEGLALNTLLPLFAGIVLAANLTAGLYHRRWFRLLAGIVGPAMVLGTLYPFWVYGWSTYMFYAGLVIMLVVSIWDIVSPPVRGCASCANDGIQKA